MTIGGIGYNQVAPAPLYLDNLLMGTYVIEAARLLEASVESVRLLDGSVYPAWFAEAVEEGIVPGGGTALLYATKALDGLKGAIETLRGQSAKFGSNLSVVETRQDFTKNLINTLQTGASNLVLADQNQESANLLTLQTQQQLGIQALSIANSNAENILQLFK